MDAAALIISIVALVLALVVAGFGIVLQLLMYRATSDQTTRVSVNLSAFKVDLEAMIGELKGQTATMAGMQKDQFNTMLDAFVRRPEAAAQASREANQSAAESLSVIAKLAELEARISETSDIQSVKQELGEIKQRVKTIGDLSSSAARLAARGRIGYSMFQYHIRDFEEEGRYRPFPADVVDLLRDLQKVIKAGGPPGLSTLDQWYTSNLRVFSSRASVLQRAIEDGLVTVSTENSMSRVALTDRARRLLDILGDLRPEDIVG